MRKANGENERKKSVLQPTFSQIPCVLNWTKEKPSNWTHQRTRIWLRQCTHEFIYSTVSHKWTASQIDAPKNDHLKSHSMTFHNLNLRKTLRWELENFYFHKTLRTFVQRDYFKQELFHRPIVFADLWIKCHLDPQNDLLGVWGLKRNPYEWGSKLCKE